MNTDMLIELNNVKKYFPKRKKGEMVKAVENVSISVEREESFGLVGESGSGKTTLARLIMGMIKPDSGTIKYEGQNLEKLKPHEIDLLRRKMGIVFQNPYSSLNPKMTVCDIIAEPIKVYKIAKGTEVTDRVVAVMRDVGLSPDLHLNRYPHEFSGGQRQRIAIARTISVDPQFVILDEPTSALDVSIQAQILNLVSELQRKKQITFFFISHNMGVIHYICNRIGVMYLGSIVEIGSVTDIFENAFHPYIINLIKSIPDFGMSFSKVELSKSMSLVQETKMICPFATYCPNATNRCFKNSAPQLKEVSPGHRVACHLV